MLEKEEAKGKTKEEAIMLLNHKEALDFILDNPDYLQYLSDVYKRQALPSVPKYRQEFRVVACGRC